MQSGTIAFLFGILSLQAFKELPELHWLALICSVFFLNTINNSKYLRLLSWVLAGFIWAWLQAWLILDQHLPKSLVGKDVQVVGYIASLPTQRDRLTRFLFDINSASFKGKEVNLPKRVRLNWYGQTPELSVGDQWKLTVRLKQPHGFMNPGGFDYEKWLFSQRIRATGYVRSKSEVTHLTHDQWVYPLQRFRQHLQKKVEYLLPDSTVQGLVSALVLGHREHITQDQWQAYRQTGTNHLIAISGLHIGLVAGLVFFMVRWLWSRAGRLSLQLPTPIIAAILSFFCAAIYAALAGWSLPTQRALIMVAVVMLAIVFKRHILPRHGFSLALLLVLLHDPLSVLSPGFWLSFGAVGLIFLAMQGKKNGIAWWDRWFRIQWIVGLGLFPFLLLFFQQGSIISPVANFIAVPLVSLLIVPILLSGMLVSGISDMAGGFLLSQGAWLLEYLTLLLHELGNLSYASWSGSVSEIPQLLISIMGVLWLLFWPIKSARWLGLVFLLPMVFHQARSIDKGELIFTLLDVGQGLSAVVQTQNHTLVFDTGPKFSEQFDTGSAVVLPYLRHQGIKKLDILLISHGDNDHIGGFDSVVQEMPVRQVMSSAPSLIKHYAAIPCDRGTSWVWDNVSFQVLHPSVENLPEKENNQSCVLHIKGQGGSILLPGDIERKAEAQLLTTVKNSLLADILVAPHHGSKTSSSLKWLQAVQPQYVIFPVGYRNRYRFPYAEVVDRYRTLGAKLLSTARDGAIRFDLKNHGIIEQPERTRSLQKRYWHHIATK
ncbi:MAG: DNA internalization-related competence protein ComEC/Rec2 [Gammaproteobacteria bacterium]|nr:DNA internalization-related competence protein ComEC/Rec2 [Gammaproteobacteria bacterium]